ncbi:hypothetical protein BLEM_1103 [Bifidobacterium lemurum]|uniref:Uncharacterized protein n=1 Tax=Bifidobacterium lemurum TaxID=1603886 RepID=A0A261FTS5_9BIFI|nr:hypothetical protein [Bifidobacterium lemurum]OZG62557.1 hypothetical protein BLEM_1103 [Bifidobacterium lemurum]QOL33889.1 hypothetical protein BL8807_08985 [Bifidobacterium lemurum]
MMVVAILLGVLLWAGLMLWVLAMCRAARVADDGAEHQNAVDHGRPARP